MMLRTERPTHAMKRLITVLIAAALLLTGCRSESEGAPATGDGKLGVVATTTILADVVAQVGGERVAVRPLLPVGVDPHSFDPAPSDLAAVADAGAVFMVGAGLEDGFIDDLIESAGAADRLVDVSEGLRLLPFAPEEEQAAGLGGEHDEEYDPHVWFDPANVRAWVDRIEAALSELDPEGAAVYAANADAYRRQLEELDGWIRGQVDGLPPERRRLVTDHAVLGYFADAYGLEQVGAVVPGISTAAQASAQDLAQLVDIITRMDVPAVFVGSTVNSSVANRLVEDTGIRVVAIYTGSLSEPGGEAATYLDYMRYNVTAIVTGLQGSE